MKALRIGSAFLLWLIFLQPVDEVRANDPDPIASRVRDGVRLKGKDVTRASRFDRSGDSRPKVTGKRRRPAKGLVKAAAKKAVPICPATGPYDSTYCIEPPSKIQIGVDDIRPRSRPQIQPRPEVITVEHVRTATREVHFPKLTVHIQPPGGKTLVNLKTIVYTTPLPFERTVQILTRAVTVRATPHTYTWHFGDGTTQTTTTPGAPYPAFDVYHQYRRPGTVHLRVTVNYHGRFRTSDQPWESIGTVSITGPAAPLLVCEAKPTLVDPDNAHPDNADPDNARPASACTR